jgi:hypothetical protein
MAGIWPQMETPEVDPTSCQRSSNGRLVAVTNDAGLLRFYNYPCLEKGVSAQAVQRPGTVGERLLMHHARSRDE